MKRQWLFLAPFMLLGSSKIYAGMDGRYAVDFNALYMQQEREDDEPDTSSGTEVSHKTKDTLTLTYYDLSVYKFIGNFGLGLRYLNDETKFVSKETQFGSTRGSMSKETWNGLGLAVSYVHDKGFFAGLAYYIKNSYTQYIASGGETFKETWDGGQAYSLDLGYGFGTDNWKIGPALLWLHYGYKSKKVDSEKEHVNYTLTDDHYLPRICFWYFF